MAYICTISPCGAAGLASVVDPQLFRTISSCCDAAGMTLSCMDAISCARITLAAKQSVFACCVLSLDLIVGSLKQPLLSLQNWVYAARAAAYVVCGTTAAWQQVICQHMYACALGHSVVTIQVLNKTPLQHAAQHLQVNRGWFGLHHSQQVWSL